MNQLYFILSVLAIIITLGGVVKYLSTIPKMKVPKKPIEFVITLLVGLGIASVAIITSPMNSSLLSITGLVMAGTSALISVIFLIILSLSKTPVGNITIKVGDSFPAFTSQTFSGKPFDTTELAGKRTLFKFYRGGWCPYCSSELKSFDDMRPLLEKYDVQILGLSNDTVEQSRIHKQRDGLSFPLLADPDLKVIRQLGIEHHKAIGGTTSSFKIFGMSLPLIMKIKPMAIPTTVLIDEHGVIQWIDQSEDYRIRSNTARVSQAVECVFGC